MHEVSKTPEVKRWESLGSCLEIDAETVKVTREKVLTQSRLFFPMSCLRPILQRLHFNSDPVCIFSSGSSSPECEKSLGHQSVFPTAPLQRSRKATSYALPIKTADSASSRFSTTEGFRLFPACRRAALRHEGTPPHLARAGKNLFHRKTKVCEDLLVLKISFSCA